MKEMKEPKFNPEEELYSMTLLESKQIYINNVESRFVVRVLGGWIYYGTNSETFIPFNDEFKPKNK